MKTARIHPWLLPSIAAIAALTAIGFWLSLRPGIPLAIRVPGTDRAPAGESGGKNPVLSGSLTVFGGQPSNLPGAWPQFRGPSHDGISVEDVSLSRKWQPGEPRELWSADLGEGYAGAAVRDGRVYLMDYDGEKKQDALRCWSLEDGREIWRFAYPVSVKRNHGMSRTVPAVTDRCVLAIGPKCQVMCLDAASGELRWGMDLVREYGATVPQWYAGQCPLIDNNVVILAPGGKDALLLAVDLETGKAVWKTPNPHGWKMTHASVVATEVEGERMYVYCADKGVVGVSARDGRILWETTEWKISIATVPSPVPLEGGRLFFSGGYKAGSMLLGIKKQGDTFVAQPEFRLDEKVFGATQQTPILYQNHLYGVRPDGRMVCLTLEGKTVWTSDPGQTFGLGSFLIADGLLFAMNDSGLLRLVEAAPEKFRLLTQAQVLKGRESWAPMAIAGGRLLARDFTRMVCLDVSAK